MLVTLRKDDMLIFAGNTDPAAMVQLYYAAGGMFLEWGHVSVPWNTFACCFNQAVRLLQGLGLIFMSK